MMMTPDGSLIFHPRSCCCPQARFGDEKERIQKETSLLYEQAGVNPLAGCLPSLASIPIFIGLYSSLSNLANEGGLDAQGFFWIPDLSGPTSLAARQSGAGISWLYPFVDGAPPSGWDTAGPYLVLPVLLLIAQYISSEIVSPPIDPNDPNAKTTKAILRFLPLTIGWFSLNVPAGLSLYYLSNTLMTTAMQVYLRKLGGAKVQINDLGPVRKPGSGRRLGQPVTDFSFWEPSPALVASVAAGPADQAAGMTPAAVQGLPAGDAAAGSDAPPRQLDPATVNRRVKRKRLAQ